MNLDEATRFANEFFKSEETAQSMLAEDAVFDFPGTMRLKGKDKIQHVFGKAEQQGIDSVTHTITNVCVGNNEGKDVIAVEMDAVYNLTRSPSATVRGLSMLIVDGNKVKEWLYCTDHSPLSELVGMADEIGSATMR